jgi:hypothetical protein
MIIAGKSTIAIADCRFSIADLPGVTTRFQIDNRQSTIGK